MLVLALFIYIFTLLFKPIQNQESITQVVSPKINWVNTGSSIDPPSITITFKANIDPERPINDVWLKFEVPFETTSLGPPIWSTVATCCDFNTMVFQNTEQFVNGFENGYTIVYVRLIGAIYDRNMVYVMQLNPDKWLTKEGYSEALKISIVSKNVDNHITYAYNYAFTTLYASNPPSNALVIQDETVDPLRFKVNQVIDSFIIITITSSPAQRIIIQALGDYKYTNDANTNCAIVSDPAKGLVAPLTSEYTCGFYDALGPQKMKYIVFTFLKGPITPGQYKLKFKLQTPPLIGSHALSVMTMARFYPTIYFSKKYYDIFACENDIWETGYPKLFYSFNLNANNANLEDQVGLFSMSSGFNKIYNSLKFIIRASSTINPLPVGGKHTLQIIVGDKDSAVPLGYIYENLPLAPGFSNKNITFSQGTITIDNIQVASGVEYIISLKVGYPQNIALPTDQTRGFGMITLFKGKDVLLKSQALMRPRFNVVNRNRHLLTVENIERNDAFRRKHRGFSAFRSADPGTIFTSASYLISTGQNGLRIGDGQLIWMSSSIGPNHLYYNLDLSLNHDSNRTILEVLTDPQSIKASSSSTWLDSQANSNCRIFSSGYNQWTDLFTITDAQTVVNPITIQAPLTGINFLNGCQVREMTIGGDKLTRMRIRLRDQYYTNSNNLGGFIRAVKIAFYDSSRIDSDAGINGNYFVWRNVDVKKYQHFKWIDTDAVILDAYVRLYFYSGITDTDATVRFPPEIIAMDNLHVLDNNNNAFPFSLTFRVQHTWMEDSNPLATAWQIRSNPVTDWPNILAVSGNFANIPLATKKILLFFDFITPLTSDEFTRVDCSVKGITVTKCSLGYGAREIQENTFVNVKTNGGFLYTLSRFSHFLEMDVDATSLVATNTFSLVIPFVHFESANMNRLINAYENFVPLNPSWIAVDSTWKILNMVDFGTSFTNYNLDIFSNSLVVADVLALEVASSQIRQLDDAIVNNNPSDVTWFAQSTDALTVGKKLDLNMKTICTGCVGAEGAALLCGNWNFAVQPTFSVANGAPDNMTKCHVISYLTPASRVQRWCLHCPNIPNVATPLLDASSTTYAITDFTMPYYTGIKWPADMIAVVSNSRVNYSFTVQNRNFLSSDLHQQLDETFYETSNFEQGIPSQYPWINYYNHDTTIESSLGEVTTTNPLPPTGVIFFGITSGCELSLTILGDDPTPPCFIHHSNGTVLDCIYSINIGGLQIQLNNTLSPGAMRVEIYGVSIKEVLSTAPGATLCKFVAKSYLTSSKNPLVAIDQTQLGIYFDVTWGPATVGGGGTLSITGQSADHYQVTAFSNILYDIDVTGRNIYRTDYLSMSLGSANYETEFDSIWCRILDRASQKIVPEFEQCQTSNLGFIGFKSGKDLPFNQAKVELSNVIVPINSSPGVRIEYYINGGFQALASTEVIWSALQYIPKFLNPVRLSTQLDMMGFRGDLFVDFQTDIEMTTRNVIYLQFSPHFLPTLSRLKIFIYMTLNQNPKQRYEMKLWNNKPRMLAVTGWPSTIKAGTQIGLQIIGVENPSTSRVRKIQVILGFEQIINNFLLWGQGQVSAAITLSNMKLIRIENIEYTSLIIREKTKLTISIVAEASAKPKQYVMVIFNYLTDELVREFKPFCILTKSNEFISIAERCTMVGNRLEMLLTQNIESLTQYSLIIDDIPNPDFGYQEPESVSVLIISADRKIITASSNDQLVNYERLPFIKRDLTQLLDFLDITGGTIRVPKGFYRTFKIGPKVVDPLTDSLFFVDQVDFQLVNSPNNFLKSIPIPQWGIDDFIGRIGTDGIRFVIGSVRSTVLTTYAVQIRKKEASGQIYTELPLLRVEVIPVVVNLLALPTLSVYKGAKSLPIEISSDNLPVLLERFDILFLTGQPAGVLLLQKQQQFSLSQPVPKTFIQFTADLTATVGSVPVSFVPVSPSSQFATFVLTLNIMALPVTPALPTPVVTLNAVFPYKMEFKVNSPGSIFLIYYTGPVGSMPTYTFSELRTQIFSGVERIGDLRLGGFIVTTLNTDIITTVSNLLGQTNYQFKYFYESAEVDINGQGEFLYATQNIGLQDGVMNFEFSKPVYYENRIRVLCNFAKRYSMSYENLWSGDGLNCDKSLIPPVVLEYHKLRETSTTNTTTSAVTTSATLRLLELEQELIEKKIIRELQSDDVETSLKKMNVYVFQSKREGQNTNIFNTILTASTGPGALNLFKFYFNGVADLTAMTPLGTFTNPAPNLSGSATAETTGNVTTIKGLSMGVEGHLYMAVIAKTEAPTTFTTVDIRSSKKFPLGGYYHAWKAGSFEFKLQNLVSGTEYTGAYFATNEDPRVGAAESTVTSFTFTTSPSANGSKMISIGSILALIFLWFSTLQNSWNEFKEDMREGKCQIRREGVDAVGYLSQIIIDQFQPKNSWASTIKHLKKFNKCKKSWKKAEFAETDEWSHWKHNSKQRGIQGQKIARRGVKKRPDFYRRI